DYPADRLEIIVVSDGSSDRTEAIVRAEGRNRVKLVALRGRNGKTIAQNRAVEIATGELLVFSDATTVYEPRCLRALVSNFSDPEVGAATGWVVMGADPDATMQKGRSAYTDYDQWLRSCESKVHSVVGTAGCIAAVRRELERRTRVIARGLRGYWYARRVFHPPGHPWFFLDLLSHRLLRWAVPVLLAIAFLANLALLGEPFYVLTFLAQAAFYGTAAVGYVL